VHRGKLRGSESHVCLEAERERSSYSAEIVSNQPISERSTEVIRWLVIVCIALSVRAEIIPASRRIDWSTDIIGVTTNWPAYRDAAHGTIVTNMTLGAHLDSTGSTDCSAKIIAFINSFPATVSRTYRFVLTRGKYRCNSHLALAIKDYYDISGESDGGIPVTELWANLAGGDYLFVLGRDDPANPYVLISSGSTKGSSNVVMSSGTYVAGQILRCEQANIPGFNFHNGAVTNLMHHEPIIKSVSGTSLTVWPPFPFDFTNSPVARKITTVYNHIGLRDLSITNISHASSGFIWTLQCNEPYMSNVFGWKSGSYHVIRNNCVRPETRHSAFIGVVTPGPNNAGVNLFDSITGELLEDNIFDGDFPSVEGNQGSDAAFLGYNFSTNSKTGSSITGYNYDLNHSAHTFQWLLEGNVGTDIGLISDGYRGSDGPHTSLRNFWPMRPALTGLTRGIDIAHWSYQHNIIGDIVGHSGSGAVYTTTNNGYTGPIEIRMGWPCCNDSYSGTRPPNAFDDYNALDFESFDISGPGLVGTTIIHGLYSYALGQQVWETSIPDHVIPSSWMYSSRPASQSFVGIPWPPFDPANPSSASATNIAAGYRYYHSFQDPGTPTPPPTNGPPPIIITGDVTLRGGIQLKATQ